MSYFSYVGRLFSNVKGFYREINAATLTGAIDSVIILQEDGSYLSSPFHVRFGKLGVLHAREKRVDIEINGKPVDLHMKLGESGEAFFVTELEEDDEEDVPSYLATSPIPSADNLMEMGVKEMKEKYMIEERHHHKKKYLTELGNEVEIIPHKEDSCSEGEGKYSDSEMGKKAVSVVLDEVAEELKKKKSRRKKKLQRRNSAEAKVTEGEIFNMDDVSSDEELANLPPMSSDQSKFPKSISLPTMEETRLQRTKQWASTQFTPCNEHPFSDTDMSPLVSPTSTRPPSPKSDTEVDRQKSEEIDQSILSEEDNTLWEWGDLPRKSVTSTPGVDSELEQSKCEPGQEQLTKSDEQQPPSGLFQFMKKTKKVRHKPEVEGIYLDDLNLSEMDPEIAKLYFPKKFHSSKFLSIREGAEAEEDNESGRGASLPVSPHSVEGAIGGPPVSFLSSEVKNLGQFSLSLCGGLSDQKELTLDKFMQQIVTYDDLCENYNMISNPELVVRIGEKFYNWQTAAPMILAQIVFGQKLPEKTAEKLCKENMPKKKKERRSWFSWGRGTEVEQPSAGPVLPTSDTETSVSKPSESAVSLPASSPASLNGSPRKNQKRRITDESLKSEGTEGTDDSDSDKVRNQSGDSYKERSQSGDSYKERSQSDDSMRSKGGERFKKTLRLSSEQIEKLDLHEGLNDITFSVTTQYQGTTRCTSHIYLWRYDDQIVVSDIDGTITKSDVLGQILPIIGKDWSQSGVAQLFTHIHNNGYKFLYLSARAIGQSKVTKDLLRSIKQECNYILPDGPLLLSPTSLVSAFHREVIERKPEEFKIACLKDIADLFPGRLPFCAGFGNKINDVYAYKALQIPSHHIFTINHRGELKQESSYTFQSSYTCLSDVADHFFPPRERGHIANEFSGIQYWRQPLPRMSESDLLLAIQESEEPEEVEAQ